MKLLAIFVAAICAGIAQSESLIAKTPIIIGPIQPLPPVEIQPVCDIVCTMEYRPVCALPMNGCGKCQTFGNGCSLGVYNCQNPGNQYYSYAGTACESIGKEDQFAVGEDVPV